MTMRNALNKGAKLCFPGMEIEISSVIGQGSNAIVYKGSYRDGMTENAVHTVLVKELFPFHPKGLISRDASGAIVVSPEAKDVFDLHRISFERGNKAHLKLLELFPEKIGGNVNTFSLNGTLYTVLSESGGRDIAASEKPKTLKILTRRMLSLLDALSAFHESNLMHLDISPDNILLVGKGENERCMLIDYNSAFSPEDLKYGNDAYFSVKQGFTAPEVISKNTPSISWSADLYSVAAVFFFMLMDRPLSLSETLQKNPPDTANADLLKDAPETVKAQVKTILKKGLNALPGRRYAAIPEMREAFSELMRRIDMLGVTHAALWEAGKRNVQMLIKNNPFYAFLSEEEKMFPIRLDKEDEESVDMDAFISGLTGEAGSSALCVCAGGMGKTTLLLKTALSLSREYSPMRPAQLYVSLAGRAMQKKDVLLDAILENLHFTKDIVTYDGARHQLKTLLSMPLKTKSGDLPTLILLLDGFNEIKGDTSYLTEEIALLSKLPGIRMVVSSRSDVENLSFSRCAVSPLRDKDIEDALSACGLLLPKSEEIRNLLKTPLMLSVFIKASGEDKQLSVQKEEELMEAYVASLLNKEKEALGEEEAEKYRVEAAVRYVLPALSEVMERDGMLTDAQMYRICEKCRKTLLSKILLRAFPAWLGHRKEIALDSADEFFGKTVHDILWRRMGLIVKDGDKARMSHARIGEYLSRLHMVNAKRIQKHIIIRNALAAAIATAVLSGVVFAYFQWGRYLIVDNTPKRPAYEDKMAEDALSHLTTAYCTYGSLYKDVYTLVQNAADGNESAYRMVEARTMKSVSKAAEGSMLQTVQEGYLAKMAESGGEVISWSQQEFSHSAALELIAFSKVCAAEYESALTALSHWLAGDSLREYYSDYPQRLLSLLDADARLAAQMYQYTYMPHAEGINTAWSEANAKNAAMHPALESVRDSSKGYEAYQQYENAAEARRGALVEVQTTAEQIMEYISLREGVE